MHTLSANSLAEFTDDVTCAEPVWLMWIPDVCRPQTVAVVILGHHHHVLRAGIVEMFRPDVGPPIFQSVLKQLLKPLVRHVGVVFSMKLGRRSRWILDRIPIVLSIRMDKHC